MQWVCSWYVRIERGDCGFHWEAILRQAGTDTGIRQKDQRATNQLDGVVPRSANKGILFNHVPVYREHLARVLVPILNGKVLSGDGRGK